MTQRTLAEVDEVTAGAKVVHQVAGYYQLVHGGLAGSAHQTVGISVDFGVAQADGADDGGSVDIDHVAHLGLGAGIVVHTIQADVLQDEVTFCHSQLEAAQHLGLLAIVGNALQGKALAEGNDTGRCRRKGREVVGGAREGNHLLAGLDSGSQLFGIGHLEGFAGCGSALDPAGVTHLLTGHQVMHHGEVTVRSILEYRSREDDAITGGSGLLRRIGPPAVFGVQIVLGGIYLGKVVVAEVRHAQSGRTLGDQLREALCLGRRLSSALHMNEEVVLHVNGIGGKGRSAAHMEDTVVVLVVHEAVVVERIVLYQDGSADR